ACRLFAIPLRSPAPPCSTPLPYTTLFRSERREPLNRSFHDVVGRLAQLKDLPLAPGPQTSIGELTEKQFAALLDAARHLSRSWRSEEHTSELQSRFDLVCRLLLEKKKGHH